MTTPTKEEVEAIVERLDALGDLATWATGGWDIPPEATAKIGRMGKRAAAMLTALQARVEAAEADAGALAALESWTEGDIAICPPGQHGGNSANWLVALESEARPGPARGYRWGCEGEGPTLTVATTACFAALAQQKEGRR